MCCRSEHCFVVCILYCVCSLKSLFCLLGGPLVIWQKFPQTIESIFFFNLKIQSTTLSQDACSFVLAFTSYCLEPKGQPGMRALCIHRSYWNKLLAWACVGLTDSHGHVKVFQYPRSLNHLIPYPFFLDISVGLLCAPLLSLVHSSSVNTFALECFQQMFPGQPPQHWESSKVGEIKTSPLSQFFRKH